MSQINSAGILIDKLGLSQIGVSLCLSLNEIEVHYYDMDIIVFNGTPDRLPATTRFAIMQQFEAWSFHSPVMATNINTAQMLAKMPCPTKKYFYVWDLDWIYLYQSPPYNILQSVYQNDDIELIARSERHYDVISRMWKQPKCIMENFDHEKLMEIFRGGVVK